MLCAPMDDPHEVQAGWLSCPLTHQHPGSQHMGTHASPWIWKPQSHPPFQGMAVLNTLCSAEAPWQLRMEYRGAACGPLPEHCLSHRTWENSSSHH